jgi:diaminobutyrate-2-oxoglutarate transaminase
MSLPHPLPQGPHPHNDTRAFERLESNVRSYCHAFPAVFARAKDSIQVDELGREYIDFFSGAGALNYGHNPELIKRRLVQYVQDDGVSHSLDMYTTAKRDFISRFNAEILEPRGLDCRIQFCGPTGTNSVEAAMKLARRVTGRNSVYAFTGGFHGMSLGSLSVTSNRSSRAAAGVPLPFSGFLPFPDGPHPVPDSLQRIAQAFDDSHSGLELPAAIIFETTQCEGGIYVAPDAWLQGLRELCDRHGIILICDDIQTGCGRTGTFFSFERSGIKPDFVTLSKSISGYGLPMSLLLIRRHLDQWNPADHTGTFRGNQLAFVAAAAALDFWQQPEFLEGLERKASIARDFLQSEVVALDQRIHVRGLGLLLGVDFGFAGGTVAQKIARRCFDNGLIIERTGREDTVIKLMPPLTIPDELLLRGCRILRDAIAAELGA